MLFYTYTSYYMTLIIYADLDMVCCAHIVFHYYFGSVVFIHF